MLRLFAALPCFLALVACAGSERPHSREQVELDISINAMHGVNPDDQKRAAPILVRVYELKSADAFNQASFYSLQDKDRIVLADDLVARDQLLLRPGEHRIITRRANDATITIGVIAAYRDLPNSVWRAVWPLPAAPISAWYYRAPKLRLAIDLDVNEIRITDMSSTDN